jgi:hypothetical protein
MIYPLKERFERARFLEIDDEKLARFRVPSDKPMIP